MSYRVRYRENGHLPWRIIITLSRSEAIALVQSFREFNHAAEIVK